MAIGFVGVIIQQKVMHFQSIQSISLQVGDHKFKNQIARLDLQLLLAQIVRLTVSLQKVFLVVQTAILLQMQMLSQDFLSLKNQAKLTFLYS